MNVIPKLYIENLDYTTPNLKDMFSGGTRVIIKSDTKIFDIPVEAEIILFTSSVYNNYDNIDEPILERISGYSRFGEEFAFTVLGNLLLDNLELLDSVISRDFLRAWVERFMQGYWGAKGEEVFALLDVLDEAYKQVNTD